MKRNIHDIPLYSELAGLRDDAQAVQQLRFFKCGEGQYGEGDRFLGVRVPQIRRLVARYWKTTSLDDLHLMLSSPFHESRMAALLTLVQQYKHAKNEAEKEETVQFYIRHLERINNWDLVDLSCYEILGPYLWNRDRQLLYDWAQNGETIWQKRIAIVSTMYFVRRNDLNETLNIAGLLLSSEEDLLHKAVGWLLRDVGKRDGDVLRCWLKANYSRLPRTALRYAIEHFPEEERLTFLKGDFN